MRSAYFQTAATASHRPLLIVLFFVLAFGTPAVPALRFAAAETADSFPLCPLTKQPPVKRDYPSTRCVEASEYSCCTECYDWFNALVITSANSSSVIEYFAPSLSALFASKAVVNCAIFNGYPTCQQYLEAMPCAIWCNPDMGLYYETHPGWQVGDHPAGIFHVCNDFSQKFYSACGSLPVPGFNGPVSSFFPTAESFTIGFFEAGVNAQRFQNVSVVVEKGTSGCYNGPSLLPPTVLCCDPLNAPSGCTKDWAASLSVPASKQIGQTTNSKACAEAALSPAAAPTAPSANGTATGPTAIPSPSTPSPPQSSPKSSGRMVAAGFLWAVVTLTTMLG